MVAAVAFAVSLLLLWVNVRRVYPFLADDALISLRYADRLLHGEGLTWNTGERVEGYSNLLWVLLCALLGGLGLDLVTAVRVLGSIAVAVTFAAVVRCYCLPGPARRGWLAPAVTACAAMALSSSFAVWTTGGLEQPLLGALLAWSLVLVFAQLEGRLTPRRVLVPSLLLGLAAWTRPDGILFAGAIALAVVVALRFRRAAFRAAVLLVAVPLVFVAAQLLFRRFYYHDWVPNTAHVKLDLSETRAVHGANYVRWGLDAMKGLLASAALLGLLAIRDGIARRRAIVIAIPLVVWLEYVRRIGGDLFPGWRHLFVVVVLLAFAAGEALAAIERTRLRGRSWIAAVVGAGAVTWFAVAQWNDNATRWAIEERWELDCAVTGKLLGRAWERARPLAAVDPAGCFPYFSRLPAIDMLGLNDRFIATHPHRRGSYNLGHEIGNGAYVIGRKPDLVLFCEPAGKLHGCFPSGVELDEMPEFHRAYRPVTFEGTSPHVFRSTLYARVRSPAIGVREEGGRILVPGWLFAADGERVVRAAEGDVLGASCGSDRTLRARELPLRPGKYRLRVESSGPIRRARVVSGRPEELTLDDTVTVIDGPVGDVRLDAEDVPVSLEVQCGRDTDLVTGAVLERLDGSAVESLMTEVEAPAPTF